MVWVLDPVDTVRGAPPFLSPSRYLSPSYLAGHLWVLVDGLVNACSYVPQGFRSVTSSLPGRTRSVAKVPSLTSLAFLFI
jgi:hypothetical protein